MTRDAATKKPIVLSQSQIEEFYEIGWITVESVFSPDEIKIIGEKLDSITRMAEKFKETTVYRGAQFVVEGSRIDRVVWCGAAEPELLRFGGDSRLINPVSQILGSREMDQLICQYHPKLPKDNVQFDWHQDSQHRGWGTADWKDVNGKGSYVQTLTAVDPVELDNGPVLFIPRSGHNGHLELDKKPVTDFFDLKQAIPLTMKPGSTVFFGPYSVHGSYPNESDRPRRVFINGYAYPGANHRVYPGEGSGRRLVAS